MTAASHPGVLYVVATPIGNLEDLTYRAARVLREEVDIIACEDTRHSQLLLQHYGVARPTLSFYRENESRRTVEILKRLQTGASVALISDAGTPLLSDPGARLVARAAADGIRVVPLPGASAPLAALIGSGVLGGAADADSPITMLGFLPQRAGERRRQLHAWAAWPGTLVAFESPHRLVASLADLEEIFGPQRHLVLARELTKLHEEFLRDTVAELRSAVAVRAGETRLRGEFTLVLAPAPAPVPTPAPVAPPALSKAELKRQARELGLSRSELYRRLQQGRLPTNRQRS